MSRSRKNHYVPQWYQRGFLCEESRLLHYLNLSPDKIVLPNGKIILMNERKQKSTSQCFYQLDLYTTYFGPNSSDRVEKYFFGEIDNNGSKAVRALINGDTTYIHHNFRAFFEYIDSQKLRTPKGLEWIKNKYPRLNQSQLMNELLSIKNMLCTIWAEGVREIVSANNSNIKFLISDHPVTTYNYACPPNSSKRNYLDDTDVLLKGTQTIFPLDKDHCLILTNLEYANDPIKSNPLEKRSHPKTYRQSMVRTDAFIRTRNLTDEEVMCINYVLKRMAKQYVASAHKKSLYPEKYVQPKWEELKDVMFPNIDDPFQFGGEIFAEFSDGRKYYQDQYGRQVPENNSLKKVKKKSLNGNDPCGCGSGKKYKYCCKRKPVSVRPTWDELSIRERNLIFCNKIKEILGLADGKTWNDVRKELSDNQIKEIYQVYSTLWPTELDIFDLLPKPDGTLRALYTGFIDPRITPLVTIGALPYFGEIIVQQPFVNPRAVNPKFNPIQSPHSFKQQSLKDFFLLLLLEPFIASSAINFVPDPCFFDNNLQEHIFAMAEEKKSDLTPNKTEEHRFYNLFQEDHFRSLRLMPEEFWFGELRKHSPRITDLEIREIILELNRQKNNDPFSLLQSNVLKEGGQLLFIHNCPIREMSLLLAQATGSILFSDSETRQSEIRQSQDTQQKSSEELWPGFRDSTSKIIYNFTEDLDKNVENIQSAEFLKFRSILEGLVDRSINGIGFNSQEETKRFTRNLIRANDNIASLYRSTDKNIVSCNMEILVPKGGFTDQTISRFLLMSGVNAYLPAVPMAVFLQYCEHKDKV